MSSRADKAERRRRRVLNRALAEENQKNFAGKYFINTDDAICLFVSQYSIYRTFTEGPCALADVSFIITSNVPPSWLPDAKEISNITKNGQVLGLLYKK